jgi:hypothetical protein
LRANDIWFTPKKKMLDLRAPNQLLMLEQVQKYLGQ